MSEGRMLRARMAKNLKKPQLNRIHTIGHLWQLIRYKLEDFLSIVVKILYSNRNYLYNIKIHITHQLYRFLLNSLFRPTFVGIMLAVKHVYTHTIISL